ncbi:MAG: GTP-binding protein, partial [Pontiellaceae bacterium]|nr:GTP-binding protein [Pontiellaceae bacterium]
MKGIPISGVRNFALMGHTGSGKTSLLDVMLNILGTNERVGSVDEKNSMADWTPEEQEHEISIWAKPFDGVYTAASGKQCRFVVLDTPGYADFIGQLTAAAEITDAGLIVVDSVSGIQVGTSRAWKVCEKRNLPRGIVITGLDKPDADFSKTLAAIKAMWGESRCVPVVFPTADGKSEVDILNSPANAIPADLANAIKAVRDHLIELAAETDDKMMEKYFNGEELTADEFSNGLRKAVHEAHLIPVFACSAKTKIGVKETMDSISRLFPSPEDYPVKCADGHEVATGENEPFAGLVWRSVNDAFTGQLSFVRVYRGSLKPNSEVLNATKGEKERIGSILYINGKKTSDCQEAKAGDIIALPKLKNTCLNDTLCAPAEKITFTEIEFPHPVMAYAVEPKTKGDEDKIGTALHRAAEEDPSIRVERNTETRETLLWGMGDVHLDVTLEHIKNRSKVDITHHTPKVAYRETITAMGEGHYKHKKQSGGRGQYGECYVRVYPRDAGDEEWFANKLVGGSIPNNFVPACQKGFLEGMAKGPLVGAEV